MKEANENSYENATSAKLTFLNEIRTFFNEWFGQTMFMKVVCQTNSIENVVYEE